MVTSFAEKVYALTRRIPRGRVSTYKEIARALGTEAFRAVGQALRRNPYAPDVPCHRVVASDGSLGGFRGKIDGRAISKKRHLLAQEGVVVEDNRIRDFARLLYRF